MIRAALFFTLLATPAAAADGYIMCPAPNVSGAKLDKAEPCATQRDVMRTVDAPKGKPSLRKRVRVK